RAPCPMSAWKRKRVERTEYLASVVARTLLDERYLTHLEAAGAHDSDPRVSTLIRELDLANLRRFGAFIVKVQHNFLWESLPHTRRTLCALGLETEIFGAYRRELDRTYRERSREQKTSSFITFLERHLRTTRR